MRYIRHSFTYSRLSFFLLVAVFSSLTSSQEQTLILEQSINQSNLLANQHQSISSLKLSLEALNNHQLNQAKKFITQAIKLSPENPEIQFAHGRIYAALAIQGNVFHSASYAKKSLTSFKEAVRLQPNNIEYKQGLMGFYLAAPKIVGGSNSKALLLANEITRLHAKQGVIAQIKVYLEKDDSRKLPFCNLFSLQCPQVKICPMSF